jgi:hypothetical protein
MPAVIENFDSRPKGNRIPKGSLFLVRLRSVDDWPLAKIFIRFLGVSGCV